MDPGIAGRLDYFFCTASRFICIPANKHYLVVGSRRKLTGNGHSDGTGGSSYHGNATMAFFVSVHSPHNRIKQRPQRLPVTESIIAKVS